MKYWIVFRIFESIAEEHTKNSPNLLIGAVFLSFIQI